MKTAVLTYRYEFLAIIFLSAIVAVLHTLYAFKFPPPWNDETAFIAQAFELSRTGSLFVWGLNPDRVVAWMPPGYMLVLAAAFKLFGYSFTLARATSGLFYVATFAILAILMRQNLTGNRRLAALAMSLLVFLAPMSIVIANIARMEALFALLMFFALLASIKSRPILGAAIVLATATVHFNAIYFLLPVATFFLWNVARQTAITVYPTEIVALGLAATALALYVMHISPNAIGFVEDMRYQFGYKIFFSSMAGIRPKIVTLLLCALPILQLATEKKFSSGVFISLFGISFVAMALNGFNMWYEYGQSFGYFLIALGLFISLNEAGSKIRYTLLLTATLAPLAGLGLHAARISPQFVPMIAALQAPDRAFLPDGEFQRIRNFIASREAGTIISFGYTGIEPFFFDDIADANVRWSILGHSVTQPKPARIIDARIHCDSSFLPAYLSTFDLGGYAIQGHDTGCIVKELQREAQAPSP